MTAVFRSCSLRRAAPPALAAEPADPVLYLLHQLQFQGPGLRRALHADLQAKGVRCWFAPEDMKIGAKILDAIDEAIRLRDKVLLVLSKDAIASDWVEGEVTRRWTRSASASAPCCSRSGSTTRYLRRRRPGRGCCGGSGTSATSPAGRTTTLTARASSACCATLRSRRRANILPDKSAYPAQCPTAPDHQSTRRAAPGIRRPFGFCNGAPMKACIRAAGAQAQGTGR